MHTLQLCRPQTFMVSVEWVAGTSSCRSEQPACQEREVGNSHDTRMCTVGCDVELLWHSAFCTATPRDSTLSATSLGNSALNTATQAFSQGFCGHSLFPLFQGSCKSLILASSGEYSSYRGVSSCLRVFCGSLTHSLPCFRWQPMGGASFLERTVAFPACLCPAQ